MLGEEHVAQLEVSVKDLLPVNIIGPRYDLEKIIADLGLCDCSSDPRHIEQGPQRRYL